MTPRFAVGDRVEVFGPTSPLDWHRGTVSSVVPPTYLSRVGRSQHYAYVVRCDAGSSQLINDRGNNYIRSLDAVSRLGELT